MRTLGMVFVTGAAAIVVWKILAALFMGLLGLVFKVALVILVVYLLLKIFQGNNKEE